MSGKGVHPVRSHGLAEVFHAPLMAAELVSTTMSLWVEVGHVFALNCETIRLVHVLVTDGSDSFPFSSDANITLPFTLCTNNS